MASLKYEHYTITLDTIGQTSSNTFTCYLAQPLHNIVHARLSAAHIKTTEATAQCYISIEELDSHYTDHTSNVYDGQSNMTKLRNTFASLVSNTVTNTPSGNDTAIVFKDEYTVETFYNAPIKSVDRFRVRILDQDGNTIKNPSVAGNNFIILRLTCLNTNM